MIGPNYFRDPKDNVLNIEFEDFLLYDRKFRACDEIFNLYDLDYDVYYVATLFFEIRLFYVDWIELDYPNPRDIELAVEPIFCLRFFKSFTVYFSLFQVKFWNVLLLFCLLDKHIV